MPILIPSRSHLLVSIQVLGCEAFGTHLDSALQIEVARRSQANWNQNLKQEWDFRDQIARSRRVYRAGCRNVVSLDGWSARDMKRRSNFFRESERESVDEKADRRLMTIRSGG